VFRDVDAPVYDDMVRDQVERAKASKPADLRALLDAGNVWDVE
jgi:2-oxoglutarate ferredoxin oxidoreductase subunit beta